MSSDEDELPRRRHLDLDLDSEDDTSTNSIQFDPLSQSHFSRSQRGNMDSEVVRSESEDGTLDKTSPSMSFHSQMASPTGGPASSRQIITKETNDTRSDSHGNSPTSDDATTSLSVFGMTPGCSPGGSTIPAEPTPAISVLLPATNTISKSPLLIPVPSNSSFKRRGSVPNENSVRIVSPEHIDKPTEEIIKTPTPESVASSEIQSEVDFPSPMNFNTDSPASPEPIKQQRPVKKISPTNSSHNPVVSRRIVKERQATVTGVNSAVRIPKMVQNSLTKTMEETDLRPAMSKVVYSDDSKVITRVREAEHNNIHRHVDPYDELLQARNERAATQQIKKAIQKDLDQFAIKLYSEEHINDDDQVTSNDEAPVPSTLHQAPFQSLEERMCRAKIINKIYTNWKTKPAVKETHKAPRKSRSVSPQQRREAYSTSPNRGKNPPTASSHREQRNRSVPPQKQQNGPNTSFTPDIDPWKNTVKVVQEHLPLSRRYGSAGDRLHEQGDIKRRLKDIWATRNKQQNEHWDAARHSYHPIISDFARGVGVRTRRDDQDHHNRIIEKKRQLYDRYADADLNGCTFQPSINPISELLVPTHNGRKKGSKAVHNSVYRRGVAMKQQRDAGVKELLEQIGDELPAPKSKKILVKSHETQQWLQKMMRPRMGIEMHDMTERAHSQSRSQSVGKTGRSRSTSPPAYLFYDAAEQNERKNKVRERDLLSKQETANVGQYLGSRTRELAERNRVFNIINMFTLFDQKQTGRASLSDIAAVVHNIKNFPHDQPEILNLLLLTRNSILPSLAASGREFVSSDEFTKICLSKMKKQGLYHSFNQHQQQELKQKHSKVCLLFTFIFIDTVFGTYLYKLKKTTEISLFKCPCSRTGCRRGLRKVIYGMNICLLTVSYVTNLLLY